MTGPGTYVYDGNGNPTTWSGTSLTFDVENRMTAYGTTLTAGYRGDGLRAWKNTSSGQTYFLYDGISVVCELDNSGSVIAGSTYGAAGLLSRGSVQYQFDNLGDATIRLDGSGNVLSYRLFDAWGNELTGGTEPYGYRARYGYYADGETGLIALAYRYYAPGVGRSLNRDPLDSAGRTFLEILLPTLRINTEVLATRTDEQLSVPYLVHTNAPSRFLAPGTYLYVAASPLADADPLGLVNPLCAIVLVICLLCLACSIIAVPEAFIGCLAICALGGVLFCLP